MGRHIGVRQVYVVFLYRDDTVHDAFHAGFFVAFGGAPFAVDDVFFCHVWIAEHQFFFYQVLYLFD